MACPRQICMAEAGKCLGFTGCKDSNGVDSFLSSQRMDHDGGGGGSDDDDR